MDTTTIQCFHFFSTNEQGTAAVGILYMYSVVIVDVVVVVIIVDAVCFSNLSNCISLFLI